MPKSLGKKPRKGGRPLKEIMQGKVRRSIVVFIGVFVCLIE